MNNPAWVFTIESQPIFSASASVASGEPSVLQHSAHLSVRQSRRVESSAGDKRNKPFLLALIIDFIKSHVIILVVS